MYTPGEFTVYVQDAFGCQATHSFVIEPYNPCISSDLSAYTYVEENTVEITGTGGILPYTYALDDPLLFSEENWYGFLSEGSHVAYIRSFVEETVACVDSVIFEIPEGAISPLLPIYPEEGQYYIPVTDIDFEWEAGNFAPDQIYDLYLDFGDGMSLIASDIEPKSYFYTGPIPYYHQACSWKIVVKDQVGNPKDEATFTFTTCKENPESPDPATLIYPGNGVLIDTISIELQWMDQPSGFVYDVYLDATDASTLRALNLTDPNYTAINLENNTWYYWKVITKSLETGLTAESSVFSFRADTAKTVTDIDGNVYQTVLIGGQKWLKENLKALHFNDGTPIDKVEDNTEWANRITPAYCWYNNDSISYAEVYGPLYNWFTVDVLSNGNKNVCPDGWHASTYSEWTALQNYLGGYTVAGGKLKEAGTLHWLDPNTGATNETGFTALPAGRRDNTGAFSSLGTWGRWWTTSESNPTSAWWAELFYASNSLQISAYPTSKPYGTSVRCLKD